MNNTRFHSRKGCQNHLEKLGRDAELIIVPVLVAKAVFLLEVKGSAKLGKTKLRQLVQDMADIDVHFYAVTKVSNVTRVVTQQEQNFEDLDVHLRILANRQQPFDGHAPSFNCNDSKSAHRLEKGMIISAGSQVNNFMEI